MMNPITMYVGRKFTTTSGPATMEGWYQTDPPPENKGPRCLMHVETLLKLLGWHVTQAGFEDL